ncbi:putative SET domain-containing protein [Leptodontidium sp. 2 PMI_412]|nr:putative SET domain-containing protein [Leptodontidium sp. MPI-SDFR-AT-0119]KAH9223246.1 putative SET domain-containing protein [Leptodontidium sp. 2 PMI_412]
MEIHEAFTEWTLERGVKINGIAAHRFEGRGLGIIAEKKHAANTVILNVPLSALRTADTVPKDISRALPKTTVHNLLATDLTLDTSAHRAPWRAVLPPQDTFKDSMPLLWPTSLQALLPPQAAKLLANQQLKLKQDWALAFAAFPSITHEAYLHSWLLINTRTFYFVSPAQKGKSKPPPAPTNRDDCLALSPFADYFNHTSSSSACEVIFSADGYSITTPIPIKKGEEVYISYGNHSNDFLLAEYGFILAGDTNQWDEVELDAYVMNLLSADKKEILEEEGFLGNYVLDRETVCYRTQVALRLACLPVGKWRRFVSGSDDGEKDQGKVDQALLKILRKYQKDTIEKIRLVRILEEGTADQRGILGNRWQQIGVLLQAAIGRIQS